MPLARANGCALTHPLSACCQQERTLRTRQSQGPGVICRPRSRRQKRSKPLPRPLWQNEAKKPRSLKRLQPGADGNRGKRARPNHRAPPSPSVLRPAERLAARPSRCRPGIGAAPIPGAAASRQVGAGAEWSTRNDPGAWPFDLAPLPQIGGAGIAFARAPRSQEPKGRR